MLVRVLFVVPVALVLWWFLYCLGRQDEHNWILWIMKSDASTMSKAIWGLISFAGTVAVIASLALFWRRSALAFAGLLALAYGFANIIGTGFMNAGHPMMVDQFLSLAIGMAASIPMLFSDALAGNQIDVVGDGK